MGDNYCSEGDVYRDYETFSCINPGLFNSSCEYTTEPRLIAECDYDCLNGECFEPECTQDEDCGEETTELVCVGKDIKRKITTPKCIEGTCENEIDYEFVEYCKYGCEDGECEEDDDDDYYPEEENYCGDGYCDIQIGENEINCLSDCKVTKKRMDVDLDLDMTQLEIQINATEDSIIKLGTKVLGVEESKYGYIPVIIIIVILVLLILLVIVFLVK